MQTKRLLSAFLTLVMVLSMIAVPVPVHAEEGSVPCAKTTGCTLTDGHEGECVVPETTYCANETCLLHKTAAHETCEYCANESCTIRDQAHTECQLPAPPAACGCTDKCVIDAVKADCPVCTAATADTLAAVCVGKEPVFEPCDAEGCDLVKGHAGEHTGASLMETTEAKMKRELEENGKYTLTENVALTAPLVVGSGKTMELTINTGVTLSTGTYGDGVPAGQKDSLIIVQNGGKLTIKGEGTIDSKNLAVGIKLTDNTSYDAEKAAVLVYEGCTLNAGDYGIGGNGMRDNTEITISGGKIVTATGIGVFHPQNGKLAISGNAEISGAVGVYVCGGEVNVTGGKITGTGEKADYNASQNGATLTGDALVVDQRGGEYGTVSASVTGGDFKSTNAAPVASYAATGEAVKGFISGGSFDADVNELCAPGYKVTGTGDNWSVAAVTYVAQIGETKYETLAEAVAAVGDTKTEIKVLSDVTSNELITIAAGKDVVLDLGGKTLTIPGIMNYGKLDVKNGKIVGNDTDYSVVENNGADAELTINITAEALRHGIRADGGKVTVTGGSYTVKGTAGMTTHALNASSGAQVTIKDGTFTGPAGTAGDSGAAVNVRGAGTKVAIEKGTFSGGLNDTLATSEEGVLTVTGGTYDQDPGKYLVSGYCTKSESGKHTVAEHTLTAVDAVAATCQNHGIMAHHKCANCGKLYKAADGKEEVTQSQLETVGTHSLEKQEAVPATCEEDGTIEHWQCKTCLKRFDANNVELADDKIIDTDRKHTLEKQNAVKATCQSEGSIEHWKCTTCDGLFADEDATTTLTAEQVKTTGTHDLKYHGGKVPTYDADGSIAYYSCEVTGCGMKFSDAKGETELTGSIVIPMLSYVDEGVLVIKEDAIANEGKKNVVLDLLQDQVMGELKEVTQVQFETDCLAEHVDNGGTLWIYLTDGEVYFDNDSLETIVKKAQGSTVTLLMDEITKTDSGLTAKQKTTLNGKKDPYIVRLQLTSGGKRIEDEFGGKVYVYLTEFTPKTGYKNSNYSGYFLDEDGTTEKVSYYSRDARITVEHFSEYFLARNVKAASTPTTGDTSNVMVWAGVGLAAVVALAVLLILSRKKKA